MNSVEERFNEILNSGNFVCTQEEFDMFSSYGYLLKIGDRYATRRGKIIDVDVITQKPGKLDIDLSGIIGVASDMAKSCKISRVFCMTNTSCDKYKACGTIVEIDGNLYFKVFDDEYWLVVIV